LRWAQPHAVREKSRTILGPFVFLLFGIAVETIAELCRRPISSASKNDGRLLPAYNPVIFVGGGDPKWEEERLICSIHTTPNADRPADDKLLATLEASRGPSVEQSQARGGSQLRHRHCVGMNASVSP